MTDPELLFVYVFGAVAAIVLLARGAGKLFTMIGQPAVVGEVAVGLLLGPSVLGRIRVMQGDEAVRLDLVLIPSDVRPFLGILAQLGLVIYMFVVGLELDPEAVRRERLAAVRISLSSIALAFVLGAVVGALLVDPAEGSTQLSTALFCGLAISGSAFAILARILEERRLFRTRIGAVLMGCAVVDDIAVWILVGVVSVVGVTAGSADGSATGSIVKLVGFGLFSLVLFLTVRRWLFHPGAGWDESSQTEEDLPANRLAILIAGLLISAAMTDYLLGSPILGAFMFGAAVPRRYAVPLIRQVGRALAPIATIVLLPVFFALTGLRVDTTGMEWWLLAVFLTVATAGKMLGAAGAAYASGFKGRRALAIGALMNTRGLTELAILSIGLSSGIIDGDLFSVLVCTAIGATLLSGPLFATIYPERLIDKDIASVERDLQATTGTYRIMVVLQDVDREMDDATLGVARWLAACEPESEMVLAMIGTQQRSQDTTPQLLGDITRVSSQLERLRAIGDSIDEAGVTVVPQALLSDDPVRELVALVQRLEPTVVVVPTVRGSERASQAIEQLLGQRIADVVRVDGPVPDDGAAIVVSGGPGRDSEAAAAEAAVRVAFATRRRLTLPRGRRMEAYRQAARAGGVALEGDGFEVVLSADPAGAAAVAFGRPDAHRERLAESLTDQLEAQHST